MAKPMEEITWRELEPGAVVSEIGNAREYQTGTWRTARPLINSEGCIRCGVCWIFCPDAALKQAAGGYFEVDLYYCKGCGICARECITGCITMVDEKEE